LFAEVWFMRRWLMSQLDAREAVRRWRGPQGARHDFEWQGKSVEVKATSAVNGRIFHINGLDQLDLPDNGKLLFFGMRIRNEQGASHTLSSIIAECRDAITHDLEALSIFEELLEKAGYSLLLDAEYSKLRLRVLEELLYSVEGSFPRITSRQISEGIPLGVQAVEYEIDLIGSEVNLLATSPINAPEF
jgi:hypothetical protein